MTTHESEQRRRLSPPAARAAPPASPRPFPQPDPSPRSLSSSASHWLNDGSEFHRGSVGAIYSLARSIAGKFISSDVVFIDTGCDQHLSHQTDHGGRPGNVVDRPSQIIQILGQHFSVVASGFDVTGFFGA